MIVIATFDRAEVSRGSSLPKLMHDIIEAAQPQKWEEDLDACVKAYGEEHDLVKGTRALIQTKQKMLGEKLRAAVENASSRPECLTGLTNDERMDLALEAGFNNRSIGEHRIRKVLDRLGLGPASEQELADFLQMKGEPLKQLLKNLKADGKITEDQGIFSLVQATSTIQ